MHCVTILCVLLVEITPLKVNGENDYSKLQENESVKTVSPHTLPVFEQWNTSLGVQPNSDEDIIRMDQTLSSTANEENGYSLFEEHTLAKNTILKTFPVFQNEWSISFEVNPSYYERNDRNILYLGYPVRYNNIDYLALVLRINVQCYSSTACSARPKQLSYTYMSDNRWKFFRDEEYIPKTGEWTQIKVSQQFDGENYKIHFNKRATSKNVLNPRVHANVRLYASDQWNEAQPGQIRKLHIINGHIG